MTNNSWPINYRRLPWKAAILCLAFAVLGAGCGTSDLAPVSGTVSVRGVPVKGGMLIFSPVASGNNNPGRPAYAEVQPDGSYVLKTGNSTEGALVGHQHVSYTPPEQPLTEQQRKDKNYRAPLPPYVGLVPKQQEVDVSPGNNTIDIELVPVPGT